MEALNLSSILDNKVFAVTVAYCPAALLARSLIEYKTNRTIKPSEHIVVQGHYPINKKKNNHDIALICESMGVDLWDPGKDLGSAQSQNWCLERLAISENDYFINVDPDSNCRVPLWDAAMWRILHDEPNCTLISCMAPMVERYLQLKLPLHEKRVGDIRIGIPQSPTPFNLSMWRYSFVKQIGGIPQLGLSWGETEAPFNAHCQSRGKYHAYLLDYMEDENGKFMQDSQHNEYKNAHMRSLPQEQFIGSFEEYLRWKYPNLVALDTCKNLDDHNHP